MTAQLGNQYRLIGRHLYSKRERDTGYLHVAVVPPRIKSLSSAVRWFVGDGEWFGK